jgi:hypothetical protein
MRWGGTGGLPAGGLAHTASPPAGAGYFPITIRCQGCAGDEEEGGGALALALTPYGRLPHPAWEAASKPFLLLHVKRFAPLPHNGEV